MQDTINIKKLIKDNRAVFDQVVDLAVGLAAVAITFAVVFLIGSEILANPQVSADGNATQAVEDTIDAAATLPDWLDLIVLAIIGAILLGLVAFFRGRGRGRR